jgi:hypothetical protein
MLAHSQFAKFFVFCFAVCANGYGLASPLKSKDLENPALVAQSQTPRLSPKDAALVQLAVKRGTQEFHEKRFDPAYKSWAFAATMLPNSANLVMMAESILRSVGSGKDTAYKKSRQQSFLPHALRLYESALAAEKTKPMLGTAALALKRDHACLKAYLETNVAAKDCGPLISIGAR